MNRRHLFKTLAGVGCAASLGLPAKAPLPQTSKQRLVIINPDYENAEFEEVFIFFPGYEPAYMPTKLRFKLNQETGKLDEVPFYKTVEA